MTDALVYFAALILIVMPLGNLYFVYDGWLLYRRDPGRSPILLALLWVKTVIWVAGVFFAVYAVRFLFDLQPIFPFSGLSLAVPLLIVNLLPFSIHLVMQRFERH